MKLVIAIFLFLLIALVAVLFGAENSQPITVNYLLAQTEMKVSTLVALSLFLGGVIASIFWLSLSFVLRMKLIATQRQLNKLSKNNE